MTTFVALYRGSTVGDAKLIAVSADRDLVSELAAKILGDGTSDEISDGDPILDVLEDGRKHALSLIAGSVADRRKEGANE
jgi:hypothetical protein